jgi:hypothetical protein
MVTLATMAARLARLEQRTRPEPPVRFILLEGDDEGAPSSDSDDEGASVVWFTIRLDRPGRDRDEEEPRCISWVRT